MFLLLSLFATFVVSADAASCIIRNSAGEATDLEGVAPFKWNEAVGTVYKSEWYLSLCWEHQGICESEQPRPTTPAYIQQKIPPHDGKPGGCQNGAWFQGFQSGTGGQGAEIQLIYQGDPVLNPPISRTAYVNITCNPNGSYSSIDKCMTAIERVGNVVEYNFYCTSKIACVGAPNGGNPPTPPPGPPPPPPVPLYWAQRKSQ